MNIPTLKLYLLGHFQATFDGQELTSFRSDRARALFAYLALEGSRPLPRPHLAELLWHGYRPERASDSLRVTLSNLRKVIGPLNLFRTTFRTVQFCSDHPYFWCDAIALARQLDTRQENDFDSLFRDAGLVHSAQFLVGFERIDSDPFQLWLHERRAHYRQLVAQCAQQEQGEARSYKAAIALSTPVAALSDEPTVEIARRKGKPPTDELPARQTSPGAPLPSRPVSEWDFIPDMGLFYGRQHELTQLERWVIDERRRLVAVLGLGGEGKTALTAHFVRTVVSKPAAQRATRAENSQFAHVVWCSLLNAPPLAEVLHGWLQTLTAQLLDEYPTHIEQQLDLLLAELGRQRCLLILDNVEGVMAGDERAGYYRPGYEGYGRLFQRVAEGVHKSCLLFTSREEPHDLRMLALGTQDVRRLRLLGLPVEESQTLLREFGLAGASTVLTEVAQRCSGNPLALKLVAATIHDLFGGKVEQFLAEDNLVFDSIRDILDQQLAQLPPVELAVLTRLTIEQEPVTFASVCEKMVQPTRRIVVPALRSLQRRMVLEQYGDRFGLQNVVMEYIAERLVEQVCAAIEQSATAPVEMLLQSTLNRYPLVKA